MEDTGKTIPICLAHFTAYPHAACSRASADNISLANTPLPATDMSNADQEILANKMINEEYKIWKKNAVFLYDIMYR